MPRHRRFRPAVEGLGPRVAPSVGPTATLVAIADTPPTADPGGAGYAPGLGGSPDASVAPAGIVGD